MGLQKAHAFNVGGGHGFTTKTALLNVQKNKGLRTRIAASPPPLLTSSKSFKLL